MSDPAPTKITRLGDLPRDMPPPRDGWPALEARLREVSAQQDSGAAAGGAPGGSCVGSWESSSAWTCTPALEATAAPMRPRDV